MQPDETSGLFFIYRSVFAESLSGVMLSFQRLISEEAVTVVLTNGKMSLVNAS